MTPNANHCISQQNWNCFLIMCLCFPLHSWPEQLGHTLILRDNSDDDSGVGAINFATTMLSTVVRRSSTNASSEADVAKKNSSNNYYYSVTGDDDDDDDVMPVSQGVAVSVR